MLVPSAANNMDRERLASARLAEGVSFASSVPDFSVASATCFNMGAIPYHSHWIRQHRTPSPGMPEGASFAPYSCMWRHIRAQPCYDQDMSHPDLNLLVTLDVLLAEGSVAR